MFPAWSRSCAMTSTAALYWIIRGRRAKDGGDPTAGWYLRQRIDGGFVRNMKLCASPQIGKSRVEQGHGNVEL